MAKINYSILISDITGKLAGSVFQESFGGAQIRTRTSPRNPQTSYQQSRRGTFGYTSGGWRNLTPSQRQSFIDAAVTESEALNLFIATNVNLSLIGIPQVNTYVPAATPPLMEIDITYLDFETLEVQAAGLVTVVPSDTTLLITATKANAQTINFFNRSAYSIVIGFGAGFDLSTPANIMPQWNIRYGSMPASCRISIKSTLINHNNGGRSPDYVSTVNTTLV